MPSGKTMHSIIFAACNRSTCIVDMLVVGHHRQTTGIPYCYSIEIRTKKHDFTSLTVPGPIYSQQEPQKYPDHLFTQGQKVWHLGG